MAVRACNVIGVLNWGWWPLIFNRSAFCARLEVLIRFYHLLKLVVSLSPLVCSTWLSAGSSSWYWAPLLRSTKSGVTKATHIFIYGLHPLCLRVVHTGWLLASPGAFQILTNPLMRTDAIRRELPAAERTTNPASLCWHFHSLLRNLSCTSVKTFASHNAKFTILAALFTLPFTLPFGH
jgi:hypothetical protein